MTATSRAVLSAAAAMLLAGCAPAPAAGAPPRATSARTSDPAPAPAAAGALSGFYQTDLMRLAVSGGSANVTSILGCPDVVKALGASQWTVASSAAYPGGVLVVLQRGDRLAFAALSGTYCAGRLTASTKVPLVLGGATHVQGDADELAYSCLASEGGVDATALVQAPGFGVLAVHVAGNDKTGSQELDESSFDEVTLFPGMTAAQVLQAAVQPGAQAPPGTRKLTRSEESKVTLDVRSTAPFDARLTATALDDGAGGTADVTLGIHCDPGA